MDIASLLKTQEFQVPNWLYNVLKITDSNNEILAPYFDFIINKSSNIEGDIAEFGVYQGYSIITTAIIICRLKLDKKVHGFDSFSGFPKKHFNDSIDRLISNVITFEKHK